MPLFRWIMLLIAGIAILIFHLRAYKYNRLNRNLVIASSRKDIRPFRVLWVIRTILAILLWFFSPLINLGINFPIFQRNINQSNVIPGNNRDNNKNKDTKNDTLNNSGSNSNSNIHRGIITEQDARGLINEENVTLLPVTTGYYEIITTNDRLLPIFINTNTIRYPEPIQLTCNPNYSYWNLWPANNGLNYNSFVYEYINANKQKDVLVALLDSGIDKYNPVLSGHLAINTREVYNGMDSDNDGYIDDLYGVNIPSGNGEIQDYNGHGTHVAGILLQTFPKASIIPVKLSEGESELVDEMDIIRGLRYAIDANVNIISLSLGGEGYNPITEALIKEATDKGIIVVAAGGNDSEDVKNFYPASYTGVINVGSVGQTGLSYFSNINTDTLMPGECIYSYGLEKNQKIFMGGTSMSTPHLAGVLGTYLSLGKELGSESDVLSLLNKNSAKRSVNKVVDMPKLLGIETNNDNAYKYIGNIKTQLESIKSELEKIKTSKLTESALNNVASKKSTLSTNANNLKSIYDKLSINSGFGIQLKSEIDEYVKLLADLNQGDLYLEVDGGTLTSSLGVDTCLTENICDLFDVVISSGTKLPNNTSKSGYNPIKDYQTAVKFKIYQGDDYYAYNNKYLGEATISIPSRPKNETDLKVNFSVDTKGKLSVTVQDTANPSVKIPATITKSVDRDIVIITGENYYEVQNIINKILTQTDDILSEIKSFNNLNPFKYIPEQVYGTYEVVINTGIKLEPVAEESNHDDISEIIDVIEGAAKNKTGNILPETIKVSKVVDGDTIRIELGNTTSKARLIGVDAPESYDTRYGYTECYGKESSDYLTELLKNKNVRIEYDSTQGTKDTYGRLLVYVFMNGENINQKIIEEGYGWEYTYDKPYKYQSEFKAAETSAKSTKKGLRNKSTCNGERKKS